MKSILNAIKGKRTLHDAGFCLTVLFYFVLLPVLVWFFNPDDSELSPTDLISTGLAISCLLSVCYLTVHYLLKIPEGVKKFFTATALFLFVMTFFFPTSTGMIDGLKKDLPLRVVVCFDFLKYTLIWVALLVFVFHHKSATMAKNGLTGCAVFGAAFVLYAWGHGAIYGLETKKKFWGTFEADHKDPAAFVEFGTDRNVIILLWDGLEGKIAENVFADNQAAQDMFDGFMFFPNAISLAPLTLPSLPILYSGAFHYYNPINLNTIREIMYSDSFFLDAKKAGFRVASKVYQPTISIGGQKNFEQFSRSKTEGIYSLKYLSFLSACNKRVTPVFCQKYFRVLWKTIRKTIRGLYAYLPGNGKVKKIKRNNYDGILSRTIPFQQFRMGNFPNKLYYYHSLITHEPYYIPEKGLKGLSNSPEHAQRVFSFVLLKATVSIFDKLKQLGIYDNSLIFVVADHGGREPETSAGIMVGNSPLDLSYTGFSKYPAGAYNPLLMVKKPFAKGPLKTLKNPAMLSDIRSVISAYVKGSTLDFETLFNLSNIQKRDIKLMIRVKPKARRPLDPYIVKEFSGSLQDIPGHLAN